jgi:hypothetical protein
MSIHDSPPADPRPYQRRFIASKLSAFVVIGLALLLALAGNAGVVSEVPRTFALYNNVHSDSLTSAPLATEAESLTFSDTAFPAERNVVRALFASRIKEADESDVMMSRPVHGVVIRVALADLTFRGHKDVVAFLVHYPWFCGLAGCSPVVLLRGPNSQWKVALDNVDSYPDVRVSNHMTHGLRDLILSGPKGHGVWRWDGMQYRFAYNRALTGAR